MSVTEGGKTGGEGRPWVGLEKPKPPRVTDHYQYWMDQPPEPSERLKYWIKQFERGWRPSNRVRYMGYDSTAEWFGVWMWEYLHIIFPMIKEEK